jgi:vacuolar iron transporter family protein
MSGLLGAVPHGRHRDVQASGARAAVLGAGDGLLTNVSLVLGVAGANPPTSTVRLAGLAGLLAGAFSMAAGELVSVRAHEELVEREVAIERQELADDPRGEQVELAQIYEGKGLPPDQAATVAEILMSNNGIALDTHARLELGVDPDEPHSAGQAAYTWPPQPRRVIRTVTLPEHRPRISRLGCLRITPAMRPGFQFFGSALVTQVETAEESL